MKVLLALASCPVLSLLCLFDAACPVASHPLKLERTVLDVKIPKSISDHTASLNEGNNLIYVAGGCHDPNGNTFLDGYFVCGSISSALYSFDPETQQFTLLPEMPRARYRHAAVAVKNQVWLLGGRSLEDGLLTEVDVFDIASQTWKNFSLPDGYASSDLAAWGTETEAFFAGGYTANYTAVDTVFSIDVEASNAANKLEITNRDHLITARGDVAATVDVERGYAYLSGGFSHDNDFCEPMESVERYSLPPGDTWIAVASLPTARADKVLVTYKDHTVAMGGERQVENKCELETPSPGQLTVAVDDIEVLDNDDTTWSELESLPEHRFRFAAVVYKDAIYLFGGQQAYDEACNCLKTTDEVVTYVDVSESEGTDHSQENESDQESDGVALSDSGSTSSGSVMVVHFYVVLSAMVSLLVVSW